MKVKTKKAFALSSLILFVGLGVASCSASEPKSDQNSNTKTVENTDNKKHTQEEAGKDINSFFATFSSESKIAKKKLSKADLNSISTKPTEFFEKNFPKTMKYAIDEDEAINFISDNWYLMESFKDVKIEVNESKITIKGDTASFIGSNIKVTSDGETKQSRKVEGVDSGEFTLKHNSNKGWRFVNLDTEGRNALNEGRLTKIAVDAAKKLN